MYLFDPLQLLPNAHAELAWFKANVEEIMERFRILVARGRLTNYIHLIQKHSAVLLEHGGLAPFANDTQETLQCLLKHAFHSWTPRHGGRPGQTDTLRRIWERWFMRLHVLILKGYRTTESVPGLAVQLRLVSSIPNLLGNRPE